MDAFQVAHAIAELAGSVAFLPLATCLAWYCYQDLRGYHGDRGTLGLLVILGCFAAALALRFSVPTWGMFHDNYHGWDYIGKWANRAWALSDPGQLIHTRAPYRTSYGPGAASVQALLLALFGKSYRVVFVADAIFSSCTVLFVALFAHRVVGERGAGWVAGLLAAVWPMSIRMAGTEDPSTLALFWTWAGVWLIAGLRREDSPLRLVGAVLCISLAVQTRDSLQLVPLLALALAFANRENIRARQVAVATAVGVLFNLPFLVAWFGFILPGTWSAANQFLLGITTHFWSYRFVSTSNPLLDPALVPWPAWLLALAGLLMASKRPKSSGLWILATFLFAASVLACLKTVSNTDRYMFHLVHVPALFVLAAAGFVALVRRLDLTRRRVAGVAVGLLVVLSPAGWREAAAAYQDQTAFHSIRQVLGGVPKGCLVLYPGPFPMAGVSDHSKAVDAHQVIKNEVFGPQLELLAGDLGLDIEPMGKDQPSGPASRCTYYVEPLACFQDGLAEVFDLAKLARRPPPVGGYRPVVPADQVTIGAIALFGGAHYRSVPGFLLPACRRARDRLRLERVAPIEWRGEPRMLQFDLAKDPQPALYRVLGRRRP